MKTVVMRTQQQASATFAIFPKIEESHKQYWSVNVSCIWYDQLTIRSTKNTVCISCISPTSIPSNFLLINLLWVVTKISKQSTPSVTFESDKKTMVINLFPKAWCVSKNKSTYQKHYFMEKVWDSNNFLCLMFLYFYISFLINIFHLKLVHTLKKQTKLLQSKSFKPPTKAGLPSYIWDSQILDIHFSSIKLNLQLIKNHLHGFCSVW